MIGEAGAGVCLNSKWLDRGRATSGRDQGWWRKWDRRRVRGPAGGRFTNTGCLYLVPLKSRDRK